MRSRIWRCPNDGYVRITPAPTDAPACPICRGKLLGTMPGVITELVPLIPDDAQGYYDRVMRERPGH